MKHHGMARATRRIRPPAPGASAGSPRQPQRGAIATGLAMLVCLALLMLLFSAADLLGRDAAVSGERLRALQAAEAAEAGLVWGLAMLNDTRPIDTRCEPVESGRSFQAHYLQASAPAGSGPMCRLGDEHWTCHCPQAGTAEPAWMEAGAPQVFVLQVDTSASGIASLASTGCSGSLQACRRAAGDPARADGSTARVWADAERLPALDTLPIAALTARGSITLDGPVTLRHADATSGITLHAGGVVRPGQARLDGPPGAPAASTVVAGDPVLAALDSAQFFASAFRMDAPTWQRQPAARRLRCDSACDESLARLLGGPGMHPLLWLDGGLTLHEPAQLGSAEQPVLLVVDGPVRLAASLRLHGLVYLRTTDWQDTGGAELRGALLAEGDLVMAGSTTLTHDAAVLQTLARCCGSYARRPGSWRDF